MRNQPSDHVEQDYTPFNWPWTALLSYGKSTLAVQWYYRQLAVYLYLRQWSATYQISMLIQCILKVLTETYKLKLDHKINDKS